MRSPAVLAFLVVVVVGVGLTLAVAARDDRDVAFTLGVSPGLVAAEIAPGAESCQTPIDVAQPFGGVRFQVGTYRRPGPPLDIAVRRPGSARPIASGLLPGGYPDVSQPTVALDREVPTGARVAVCFRNRGDRRLALYGGPELAALGSNAELDGSDLRTDLTLVFTGESSSVLAAVPDVFERASLFRPVWIGAWAYWLLAGLILLLVPAALVWSLRAAFGPTDD
jgi:hypothetical protein